MSLQTPRKQRGCVVQYDYKKIIGCKEWNGFEAELGVTRW